MTDRDKVIKEFEHLLNEAKGDYQDFVDVTVDFGEEILSLLKEQEEEPNANGWISVKDRLPEKEGQYLCWFGKNTMAKGAAIATYLEMWKSFGSLESLVTYPNVTHWMPIESPEEVKNWMTDREKVIKGLEKIHTHFWVKFRGCGIKAEKEKYKERLSDVADAITLLKEQENLAKCVDQEHRVNEYLNKQLTERPEIVRCKDCKRYYANGGGCDQVLSDWFCADGKRRDDNG